MIFLLVLLSVIMLPFMPPAIAQETPSSHARPELPLTDDQEETVDDLEELDEANSEEEEAVLTSTPAIENKIIKDIFVRGNTQVTTEAILHKIPYQKGHPFESKKTRDLIKRLYFEFKRFRNITVLVEPLDDTSINLHIVVEEKVPLKEVLFEGNSHLTEKEIKEKIPTLDMPALDPEELKILAQAIKKLYTEKGYFNAHISPDLSIDEQGRGLLTFHITENSKSLVKQIVFQGNKNISSKKLRSIMYTREDWLLGFLDQSGTYIPERVELGDKHVIEQFYQSNGFLNARVTAITPEIDPVTQNVKLLFDIEEGDIYTINEISAPGNDLIDEEKLLRIIGIKPGDIYSRERITDAMKTLELVWGNFGYLYAHIDPSITPDDDKKTVNLAFHSELGKQITLNKITIRGNRKTRDKIIRRQITLEEGDLLTNNRLEESKERIQSLGFFDQREGVNWKTIRTSDTTADLDLMLKEAKTGHAGLQFGWAGSQDNIQEPWKGASMDLNVGDTNLFGSGIRVKLSSKLAHDDFTLLFNVAQPWLFDKPLYGAMDIFHRRLAYDDLNFTVPVNEIDTGALFTTGFVTARRELLLRDTFMRGALGFDHIGYQKEPKALINELTGDAQKNAQNNYNILLEKMFKPGTYGSFTIQLGQDKNNHPVHPFNGYSWLARSQLTFHMTDGTLGFYKFDLDAHYFTPLIGVNDLIFHLHGYTGFITPFNSRLVPYRELFHIGGPASVRGFIYGQIAPQFAVRNSSSAIIGTSSIGGSKALFLAAELIAPITQDMNLKGVLFYDGGAGWDNPYANLVDPQYIINNGFRYRHSVGVGIRIYNPVPMKIDCGFKLDKQKNEGAYEVHFNTSYDW